jgi:hypothetical protein
MVEFPFDVAGVIAVAVVVSYAVGVWVGKNNRPKNYENWRDKRR